MNLTIVIVNYRTASLTCACLASVAAERQHHPDLRAMVIDNHSEDGSLGRIEHEIARRGWSAWCRCRAAPVNGGFSAGNNLGIASAPAEAYLLLNSDTVLRPGAIGELLAAAARYPDAGIIGAGLETTRGERQVSTFRDHGPLGELLRTANTGFLSRWLSHREVPRPMSGHGTTDWVSFAAVLIRHAVIETVGPLDEGYFLYFEDADYCRRARRADWQVLYWPRARVAHLGGGSGPVRSLIYWNRRLPRYYYLSRARYFARFHGRTGLWGANLCWLLGRAIAGLQEILRARPPTACRLEWRDIWINSRTPLKRTGLAAVSTVSRIPHSPTGTSTRSLS